MSPKLVQIAAFVEVADQASFVRAAARLNTTQPSISARVSALETLLGTRLLERDAGSVRLTPGGAALLPHARAVLRAVEGMMAATDDAGLTRGVLRLGVTELIVHSWLPAFLRALRGAFPAVLVELTVDVSAQLSRALADRSLDLTFQNGPFQRRTTGFVPLGPAPLVWAASPDLGIDAGARLSLSDLAAWPILTHARGTLPYDQLAAQVAALPDVQPRLVPSSNLAACLQMTRDGYGVACLPEAMVRPALDGGALVALRVDWLPDPLDFAARYDAERAPLFLRRAVEIAEALDQKF